jgi:hypothetical protein
VFFSPVRMSMLPAASRYRARQRYSQLLSRPIESYSANLAWRVAETQKGHDQPAKTPSVVEMPYLPRSWVVDIQPHHNYYRLFLRSRVSPASGGLSALGGDLVLGSSLICPPLHSQGCSFRAGMQADIVLVIVQLTSCLN